MVRVAIERPDLPEAVALVDALDAYQQPLYPAESHHGIDIAALLKPQVVFALARSGEGEAIACGAFVAHGDWAELKRMYVLPALRGRGVAQAVLAFLEAEALRRGVETLRLETGNLQPQALRLYERAGYARRGPFGDYDDDPHSVFLEKSLVRRIAATEAGR